jgi:hypothetical protein
MYFLLSASYNLPVFFVGPEFLTSNMFVKQPRQRYDKSLGVKISWSKYFYTTLVNDVFYLSELG